jgi:hypothetical protein
MGRWGAGCKRTWRFSLSGGSIKALLGSIKALLGSIKALVGSRRFLLSGSFIYVSAYCYICVRILLYMCLHTAIYVSAYRYICVHIPIYIVHIPISAAWESASGWLRAYCYICVRIPICMCPHTGIYVSTYRYQPRGSLQAADSEHTALYVSAYRYICVHIPIYMCRHTGISRKLRRKRLVLHWEITSIQASLLSRHVPRAFIEP